MWNIPPIVGQKVMLDPSYGHYNDFNRTQSKGRDGYVLSVENMSLPRWLLDERHPTALVVWENGHINSYELKALLPIDSFKTIERVEFMSGQFHNVYHTASRDYIAERVIMKNDDVKHYSFFDKEARLAILRKAETTFQTLEESNQNKESVQMKYMSVLEEIERTKRAEEVVLFLEHELEGTSASKPKKRQEVAQPQPQDTSERSNNPYDLMSRDVRGVIDADFLNPCVELPLNNCAVIYPEPIQQGQATIYPSPTYVIPGMMTQVNGATGTGRSIYLEEMERLGAQMRVREEAQVMNQGISDFERLRASLNETAEIGRRTTQVPWWEEDEDENI